jgi:hypothetical protein
VCLLAALVAGSASAGLVRDVPTELSPVSDKVDDIQADMPVSFSKTVEGALKTLEIARSRNTKLQEGIPTQIQAEIDATAKWIEEGHGIDNTERNKDKAALAAALGDRVKGLAAFLGKLKNMRKRLREHIIRINEAFTAKNLENRNAMRAAKAATRGNTGLKMLMLPAVYKLTAEDKAEMDEDERDPDGKESSSSSSSATATTEESAAPAANATGASAFLEVALDAEAELSMDAPDNEVEAAKKLAAEANTLYDQVIDNVKVTRADLEIERSIMGTFRDKLRAMILKREAKLKKLKGQLTALNKAIAAGGSFAADVWPLLEAHMKVMKEWKEQAPMTAKEADAAEAKVIEAIKTGKQPAAPAEPAAPASPAGDTGNATDTGPAPSMNEEFKEDPNGARQVTVAVAMAVGGFKADAFGEAAKTALAKTLAKTLSLPASSAHVQNVNQLVGDDNAVKVFLSLRLGDLPAASAKMKISTIRDDPAPFLEQLRAAGAPGAKAVTVMGEAKTVEEAESSGAAAAASL